MATLRKRGNNWYVDIRQNGERIVRSLGPNENLARIRLGEIQANVERGKAGFPVVERQTLGMRLERHMHEHSAGKAPKTILRYREIGKHFLDFFGPDKDITQDGLRDYIAHRLQSVKSKTVNNELVFIRMVYGPRGTHPFRAIADLPTRDSKAPRYLVGDEPARLVAACREGINRAHWPDLDEYVTAYLLTGMRLAELWALEWRHCGDGVLRVTNLKTYGRRRGDKYRSVPIHPQLAPILARRRKEGLPVPYPAHHANSLLRAVQRAAVRAGLAPGVGVHTLRHTFAAALRRRGVGLDVIGKLLGHTSIETTMIYAHIQPESLVETVSLVSL